MRRRQREAAPLPVTSRGARCERGEGRALEEVARDGADRLGVGGAARPRAGVARATRE